MLVLTAAGLPFDGVMPGLSISHETLRLTNLAEYQPSSQS